jgi:hypothetical protein
MRYIDWFIWRMKNTFNTVVLRDEVGYEEYDFYHEELDDLLIPAEHLEKLPNPLTLETLSYVDDQGFEWVAGMVEDKKTRTLLYEVWIRNGQPLAYEMYVE